VEAPAFLEDGEEELEAAEVEAGHGALRGAVDGRGHEGLHLHEEGAEPFHAGGDGDAAEGFALRMDEDVGGVGDGLHPFARHLVDGQFGGGAEAVLGRPQDAVGVVPVALELKDGVDHVFEELRAGDAAVLGDMPDEEDGCHRLLGEALEFGGALADLGDGAGGRVEEGRVQGLYRVDDDEPGLEPTDLLEDGLRVGLGQEEEAVVLQAQPLGAHLDLLAALLAADVEGGEVLHPQGVLQE